MNLFALTNVADARILRFPLTAELQQEIETIFASQLAAFEAGVAETIPFDGGYTPEEGELLVIEEFADVDGLREAVANPLNYEAFDPAQHSFESIKALFTHVEGDNGDRVLIQRFERRRLISNTGLTIFFSENTFKKMSESGLMLDTRLLAVLDGASLKFQNFHFLKRVFDLSEHYREATDEEVTSFATHEKMSVGDLAAFAAAAGPLVRKKIALIRQSAVLDNFSAQQIVAAAQALHLAIDLTPDGKIVIPTNKTELRKLLRFLDEDYYESALSQTRYLSNSKRVAQ